MDYHQLSKQDLIDKVRLLEQRVSALEASDNRLPPVPQHPLASSSSVTSPRSSDKRPQRTKQTIKKTFDFKTYPTRKIALQITYLGWNHGGLAWQPEITPLTTVEGELFRALIAARLVELADGFEEKDRDRLLESEEWRSAVDLEKWGYSRAGRTDAGVSGTGQVLSLWLRSNLTDREARQRLTPAGSYRDPERDGSPRTNEEQMSNGQPSGAGSDELPYVSMLNSLLPESIRVTAWSAVSPDFDARFSCRGRHYKYFFTRFEASPYHPLDINAMNDGAQRLVGEHDFRNLCKLDKSKQIENFRREIYSAKISLVDEQALGVLDEIEEGPSRLEKLPNGPIRNAMYVFDLRGSAFLYNQVRNIMAILFLIGSGLEPVNLVEGLIYTDSSARKPHESLGLASGQFVDRKPEMAIASELPLVLWDCIYPPQTFDWQVEALTKSNSLAPGKTLGLMRTQAVRYRLQSIIALHQIHKLYDHQSSSIAKNSSQALIGSACQVFGAGESQWTKNYRPILQRPRSMAYSESNQKWLEGKGARQLEKKLSSKPSSTPTHIPPR